MTRGRLSNGAGMFLNGRWQRESAFLCRPDRPRGAAPYKTQPGGLIKFTDTIRMFYKSSCKRTKTAREVEGNWFVGDKCCSSTCGLLLMEIQNLDDCKIDLVMEKSEMDKMKLQRLSSQSRNGSQKLVHIDPREDEVKIKIEEKEKTGINLAKFISDPVASQEGKSSDQPKSLTSGLFKMFKSPTRGEDYTIPQALLIVDMTILFVATTCGFGTTLTAIDNMGQIGKALAYTLVNISTFVSVISIWNFLGRVMAGFLSEFLMQKYKVPRPLMFRMELLIACVEHVFTTFALPGSLYVASIVISLPFGAQWSKSLRSCPVGGLHFTNRKWRERANKGEGLKHLPCCGYMDVKEASLLAKRRLFVVFICFLIMSPAEGTFIRGINSETQSAQTISDSDINQYSPAVYSERTAATMEDMVPKSRKLIEPSKPQIDRGRGAQHN